MIRITRNNDFRLVLAGYAMDGDKKVWQDLSLVDNLQVELTNAPAGSYTYSVDEAGRLVLDIDGVQLNTISYGLVAKGTIDGRDWCWSVKRLFEVVKHTDDSNAHDTATIEMGCVPTGINITQLLARVVTEEEYAALEPLDNVLYFIPEQ
ncbi:MAG: hypothetical protein J5529_03010 [Prevotella sp.]|nr:hypothetical protein [Prevotella sp.]